MDDAISFIQLGLHQLMVVLGYSLINSNRIPIILKSQRKWETLPTVRC